ncbi:hypothetical protein D187_005901 [Cystobacter fuscus DSM 2262]|uniref:Uncharacterized protein n=1 Tax=Cystobacter fuscus (strain ATCC 25194 / DSM 2262 / NBRC 100088 / M29) TaxID=1242864 RepID=S9PGL1_CYSF2|nr:hypothetical protein D187_005901 [Cystobacter fuscus DSM 2262]
MVFPALSLDDSLTLHCASGGPGLEGRADVSRGRGLFREEPRQEGLLRRWKGFQHFPRRSPGGTPMGVLAPDPLRVL